MPTPKVLLTSVTSDSRKGRRFVGICRAKYDKAGLNEGEAQTLNEHPGFATYLAAGIRQFSVKDPVFPVYLEIEVGGKSHHKLLAELELQGSFTSGNASDIMARPGWEQGSKEIVKFARVKVSELGFTKSPTIEQIWERIKELGHSLCEPGDGPAIQLSLKGQLCGVGFWVAMKQITNSTCLLGRIFHVGRLNDGKPYLDADWADLDNRLHPVAEIVFRLHK